MITKAHHISSFKDGTYLIAIQCCNGIKSDIYRLSDIKSLEQLKSEIRWVFNGNDFTIISICKLED